MEAIEFYTRPRCPYSFRLRRQLRKRGIAFREINIWADDAARDRVRAVADGNETVPTLHIAGRRLVNPSVQDVTARLRELPSGQG